MTLHKSSHPGKAKEEQKKSKGDSPKGLEWKKAGGARRKMHPKGKPGLFLEDKVCVVLVPFSGKA